jgi:hypothetical protein
MQGLSEGVLCGNKGVVVVVVVVVVDEEGCYSAFLI